jgi:hypothetical protein
MTMRYAHLSPAHKLDAVRRLERNSTGTTTGTGPQTDSEVAITAADATARVVGEKRSGGALDRTGDLGIMRPAPAATSAHSGHSSREIATVFGRRVDPSGPARPEFRHRTATEPPQSLAC